ncbi:alpha/beta fold hydrolase [Pseudomonas sp. R5-89-07]|uniref:alpha/beta fold hydrolase n=1 Tax=Pseudomonas sp. R5-89-07 TaxID=658644 RepID=UPI000F55C5A2|nr:alpha/beta hydrolase [Pseudomonas sp. R5-89-07]AZF06406.1 Hydrolase, alpha/beta fold family [Pseudomonas sp. R5-89-07]
MNKQFLSSQAATQFIDINGRRLAYRTFGSGTPLVLCVRFRGTMESWDPLFLNNLVEQGFQVTIFDYSGLGQSTGERTYSPASLAKDAIELITALKLGKVIIGGWSLGGIAAQIVLAQAPQLISHVVLLATTPPSHLVKPGEALFYEMARRENDFEDFARLFFEPESASSRASAERSWQRLNIARDDASPEVPYAWAGEQLGDGPKNPMFPVDAVLQVLKSTRIPVLHLGGDHDIVFPVENWYSLSDQLPTLHMVTFPSAGHGPHLQHPSAAARHIAAFVSTSVEEDQ